MKYWKANAKLSKQISAILDSWGAVKERFSEYARQIGADPETFYQSISFLGGRYISGVIFKGEPPSKSWVRLKNTDDGWRPRARSKEAEVFESFKTNDIADIKALLGINNDLVFEISGLSTCRFGCRMHKGIAYIATDYKNDLSGCKRISDLQYESIP